MAMPSYDHISNYYNPDYNNLNLLSFNRYKLIEGTDYLVPGAGYVFMLRPALSLDEYTINKFKSKIMSTQVGVRIHTDLSTNNGFIPAITNSAEGNFETKDITINADGRYENYHGQKISIGSNRYESEGIDTINLTYPELDNMYFTYLHKIWVDYIHDLQTGKFLGNKDYISKNIIEYATSLYYFLTGPDGATLKYWCKYTGVFPINIPYSALSNTIGDRSIKKVSVSYTYSYKEDLDIAILEDFNNNSTGDFSINNDTIDYSDDKKFSYVVKVVVSGNNYCLKF